jgi:hypothetical protein
MKKLRSFREVWEQDKVGRFLISFVISTILLVTVLWYLTGIAHELGHGVICLATGGEIFWPWVFTKVRLLCNPFPEHVKEISWAMGGSFGIIASMTPIFIFKFLRKRDFILNAFLGCAFMQLGYAVFESTQNELYKMDELTIGNAPPAILGIIAVIFFTLYIDKIRKYRSAKKSI